MSKPGNDISLSSVGLLDDSQLMPLSVYHVNMALFLRLTQIKSDLGDVPSLTDGQTDTPIIVTQYALALWNRYSVGYQEYLHVAFLVQARWLVEYEQRIGEDAGGWPLVFPAASSHFGKRYLSALVQGQALSVLTRAYVLTRNTTYLEVARRAMHTFERDILDGGVSTPIAGNGIFFEQWAAYPAAHTLEGMVFALLGLHDYLALIGDTDISTLLQCAHDSLHRFLNEFDTGFWTCVDLLQRQLASPKQLLQHAELLSALATISGCEHCLKLSLRWREYHRKPITRLRYHITHCKALYSNVFWEHIRSWFISTSPVSYPLRVSVPISAFPVTGGTRAVLVGVAQVMKDLWKIEYLTQYTEPNAENFIIHTFGNKRTAPWQFPAVWLYVFTGFWKLISLLHHGSDYHIILPQDGVFTAAFAALAAKLAGVRVVCLDHGNLTLLKNQAFRKERLDALTKKNWTQLRIRLARWRYKLYWPSLNLFAWIVVRMTDHFLIPGIAGDSIEDGCRRLGLHLSRVTRFASMIDINRYALPDTISRETFRMTRGIPNNTIIIAMVCRLAPEKGIDIALESISLALSTASSVLRDKVNVIIAGDGPLHEHIKGEISRRDLDNNCTLWGEISTADVALLLGCSDIFLYTSTRGACFSMAVLEAMASGCAVVASTEPLSNKHLLAEGRGIAVPPGNAEKTGMALASLINDLDLCRKMGSLARNYVAIQHSANMFRRSLMRVTYWSALDEFLNDKRES
jgi:glycosyltransferase involved in cell wall biosynthesis